MGELLKGMTGNPAFTRPPIEVAVLGELMECWRASPKGDRHG